MPRPGPEALENRSSSINYFFALTTKSIQGKWKGITVALKEIDTRKGRIGEELPDHLYQEVKILSKLRHPNIVLYLGLILPTPSDPGFSYIITEYIPRGALDNVIRKHELTWIQKLRIARDVAKGCLYLTSAGVIHRDLKSKNVLIDRFNRAKICDFGLVSSSSSSSSSSSLFE